MAVATRLIGIYSVYLSSPCRDFVASKIRGLSHQMSWRQSTTWSEGA